MRARLVSVLAGVLLALALFEVGTRATYVAPWYERLVAEQAEKPDTIPRNRYGLRGPGHEHPKAADSRRILFLGDSFTAGSWVPDRLVFARLVEQSLNELEPLEGVARYEVLNGGVAGTLTGDWVELWSEVAPRFEPDLLVVVFFLRDGTLLAAKRHFMQPVREAYTARNQSSTLYRSSYLYRTLRDLWDKEEILALYTRRFHDSYFGAGQESAEWRRAKVNLTRLRDLARERGTSVAFVVFPMLVYLDERGYPFQRVCDEVAAFAREAGMPVHDLLPAFRGRRSSELWISALNQHPNPEGHAIAARSLLPFVIEALERHEAGR